jgi:hypothetical protein
LFKEKKHLKCVFPAAIVNNTLISHPGTSFGGPVFRHVGIKCVLSVIDKLIDYANNKNLDSIIMTLPPNIIQSYPIEAVEFSLFFRGFRTEFTELSTCVPIGETQPKDNSVRAANKANEFGICIRENQDWEQFWGILIENLKKHKTTPTHSLDDILRIKQLFPHDIRLFGAYYKDKLIAGTVLFINNKVSFETFYIAQNYEFSHFRANNLLMLKVLEWASFQGFKFLNFGVSTENKGKKLNFGLTRFKESFGGCDIVRRTYKLTLKPKEDKNE